LHLTESRQGQIFEQFAAYSTRANTQNIGGLNLSVKLLV
jgi:hypothetical protein